ncbi:MAG: O-antigen ligase family protein [Verrucomicrobia bacterium]|nr:O-antigen ligase family protein [Verrucomicrobiota bacterium]
MEFVIVALTLLAPVLGGATKLWAQAAVVLGCVVVVALSPPRERLARPVAIAFAALVALGCVGFLPAAWFATPAWRHTLQTDYQVQLPATLSPQPWMTLEGLLLGVAGVLWAGYLFTRRWRTRRRVLLAVYCAGVLGLTVLALVFESTGVRFDLWQPYRTTFGFFPNRNQTGNLIALAGLGMLALAFYAFDRKEKAGWFWATAYVISLVAVVVNGSRAGVAMFFLGSLVWVLWVTWQARRKRKLGLGLSAVLLLLASFLLFGGRTLERFIGRPDQEVDLTAEARLKIHADALTLLKEVSWHGIGLGNFLPVFAQYRVASAGEERNVHPESDWFWVGIELGWLAPVLVLAAIIYWLRKHWPSRADPNFYLLAAIVVGTVLFAAHGLVDVSGHRMGTLWPALFLASLLRREGGRSEEPAAVGTDSRESLASSNSNRRERIPSRSARWVSRLYQGSALLLGAVATAWLASALGANLFPNSASLDRVRRNLVRAQGTRNFDFTIHLANQGLRFAPLDWELYFYRGLAQAFIAQDGEAVLLDFSRARFLEPNLAQIPFEEGVVWLTREPRLTVAAWNEALRRAVGNKPALYRQMLAEAADTPEIRDDLRAFALDSLELLMIFLAQATPQEVAIEVERLLLEHPTLKALTKDQQKTFFTAWARHGNHASLEEKFAANPEWLDAGWLAYAQVLAARKNFQAACELVSRFAVTPPLPTVVKQKPLPELKRDLLLTTNDFVTGFAVYQAHATAGETADALATLRKLTVVPRCPKYFFYLQAQLEMQSAAWENAWRAWRKFLDA